MPHVLMHLELDLVIGSGGLDGKQQTYVLLDGRIPHHGRSSGTRRSSSRSSVPGEPRAHRA